MKKNTVSIYQLFPFEKIRHGDEIVLYGFGKIGRRYLSQIEETGYCRVKYIIDQRASEYKGFRIPVHTIDFLDSDEKVPIVISVYSETKRNDIVAALTHKGICKEQLVIGNHRVAVEEGSIGGSDLFQIYYLTKTEAREKFGPGFLDFWKELGEQTRIKKVLGKQLVRVGKEDDGGYIMIDDFKPGGVAYSFGISDDVSWDMDMSDRGYEIFMYDHTISRLPCEYKGFHFFKKGIADLLDAPRELDTLEHYLEENGHDDRSGMILKMDVEGAERGFLNLVGRGTLEKFDQIMFELHGLLSGKYDGVILSALKKLNETHEIYHIHANNHGDVAWIEDEPFPELLELSYVKKGLYRTEEAENLRYPLEVDRACLKEFPDIALGDWNRRGKGA